jgi:hypothetical protein
LRIACGYARKSHTASVITGQQVKRSPDVPKLLDARFMMFVGLQQDGHDRAGIY